MGRIVNYERHPIWRGLEGFGEPAGVVDQIASEVNSAQTMDVPLRSHPTGPSPKKITLGVTQLKDIICILQRSSRSRAAVLAFGTDLLTVMDS